MGLAAGDQGDLLHWIVGLHQGAHQRMAHLVISNQALATTIGEGLSFHARNHAIHSVVDFRQGGGFLATAGGEYRRFVEKIGQIGP